MRKLSIGILAIGILFSIVSNSLAGLSKEYVCGKVVSVNYQNNEVVILEESSRSEMKFVAKTIDSGVAEGVRVLVVYKPGTNQATMVKPTKR